MSGATAWRPAFGSAALLALLGIACAGGADDPAARSAGDGAEPAEARAPSPSAATRAGDAPAFLDDEAEVAMQSLSTSAYRPADPAQCGLPGVTTGGGAIVYFGCTPESGPIVRAVPARRIADAEPEAALAALLEGPTDAEREQGYLSSFGRATAGVEWRLGERGSLTWVDFDPEILEAEGIFAVPMDAAQIVATLGQFEGTDRVLILVGGEPLCKALGEC